MPCSEHDVARHPPSEYGPVAVGDRIESLDVLRGFAVLGILVMNIQSFAMIDAAYMNPTAWGSLEGAHGAIWYLSHLFAESKFFTLFAMLFGSGIVLMAERRTANGLSPATLHYRRTASLFVIGMLHGYLLWHGDILVPYALCGSIVFLAWRWPSRWLMVSGVSLLSVGATLIWLMGWSMTFMPDPQLAETRASMWSPSAEQIAVELNAYRGSWLQQMPHRAVATLIMQTIVLFLLVWQVSGIMLIGMALYKTGVVTAQRSSNFYRSLAITGLLFGLPLIAFGVHRKQLSGWRFPDSMFVGSLPNYFGSLLVASAYIGIIVLIMRGSLGRPMKAILAPVGKMALTNYLAQTLICTTIFYGHGLALYGKVDRVGQFMIVVAIWAVQITASMVWMRYFRFGPIEYLWRTMTYLKTP